MDSFFWWHILVLVRILLTFLPQSGFIHPDEFFQSVEVVAGDILGVEVLRPWEFNSSFPIRSVVPIYLTSGPAFLLLRILSSLQFSEIVNSYTTIVAPRIVMLAFSILFDIAVYRIIRMIKKHSEQETIKVKDEKIIKTDDNRDMVKGSNGQQVIKGSDGTEGLHMIGSSYITIVYYTRTFSNTTEAFLFAALLYVVVREATDQRSKFIHPMSDDCKVSTVHSNVIYGSGASTFTIALIIVLGIFNRPTFVTYAFLPYIYWLTCREQMKIWRILSSNGVLFKLTGSLFYALVLSALFVVCDSIYFSRLSPSPSVIALALRESGIIKFLTKNLTITPLNFIVYNVESKNLADHGLHPTYTHLIVNVQVLFSFLGLFALRDLVMLGVNNLISVQSSSKISTLRRFLLLSYAVPLVLLSVFPHQEPRFLVPLLAPLAVLYASNIFGKLSRRYLTVLWIIFNVFGCLFFGICHQGGIVPVINKLYLYRHKIESKTIPHHVIFWRTYMPPRHLFLQKSLPLNLDQFQQTREPLLEYSKEPAYQIHDLSGASMEMLFDVLDSFKNSSADQKLLLVCPGTVIRQVLCTGDDAYKFTLFDKFWPHFSGEDPPTFDHVTCNFKIPVLCRSTADDDDCLSVSYLDRFVYLTSLFVYDVSLK